MVQRLLKLPTSSSFFLFGARGTGKSTLLRERFASIPHLLIDLLEPSEIQSLSLCPQLWIRRMDALPMRARWVVIEAVQRLPNLFVAAQMRGGVRKCAVIARDCGGIERTVSIFHEILEGTLIGHLLPSSYESVRKRQRESPKFYFFDAGVVRAFAGTLTLLVAR